MKRKLRAFLCSFGLTSIFLMLMGGLMAVQISSSSTGYNQSRQLLAVSQEEGGHALHLSVLGQEYNLSLQPLEQAQDFFGKYPALLPVQWRLTYQLIEAMGKAAPSVSAWLSGMS